MPVPKLRHEQRPKSQNFDFCEKFQPGWCPGLALLNSSAVSLAPSSLERQGGRAGNWLFLEKRLMPETSLGHCWGHLRES